MTALLIALLLNAGPAARAEVTATRLESVIVTANPVETPEDEVASSTSKITREQIQSRQQSQAAELLRDVPGISVTNSGGYGRSTQVSIRGADSGHTLVLIDGVQMNDPLSTNCSYDFGNLSSQDLERIEVVRGSQSVLYGSNATGGVVNLVTARGSGPAKGEVEAEYGTYNSYRVNARLSGGDRRLGYALGAGRRATDGFPAADRNLGNTINSGSEANTLSARFDSEVLPRTELQAMARFSDARFNLAASGGPPGYVGEGEYRYRTGDDPTNLGTDRQLYSQLKAKVHAGLSQNSLALSFSQGHRTSDHTPNSLNPVDSRTTYDSHRLRGLYQNDLIFSEAASVSVGAEGAIEKGSSVEIYEAGDPDVGLKDKEDKSIGTFAQAQWQSPTVFASAGGRYDYHEAIDHAWTFRVAPGFRIPDTGLSLRGSLGSGFKVPGLYQRFSTFGNPGLHSERSLSYDFGPEFERGNFKAGVAYFRTDFEDLIEFDVVNNRYGNIGHAHNQGLEARVGAALSRRWSVGGSYTYLLTLDESRGLQLIRRPKHQLSVSADYQPGERAQFGVLARLVGSRDDMDAVTNTQRVVMPFYSVFALTGRVNVTRGTRVFGRIENLFDHQYAEINGFGTPGRSFFLGLGQEL